MLSIIARVMIGFRPPRPRLYEPSLSASYEAARSLGGGRGLVQETTFGPFRDLVSEGLVNMYGTSDPLRPRTFHGPIPPSFDEAVDAASREPTNVMVHPILEPLKVRLITKGNTLRQWVAGHMQRALWDHLQRFPQFVLTGRTLDRFVLSDLLERETRLAKKLPLAPANLFEDWVSGDYSAATDIRRRCSRSHFCKSTGRLSTRTFSGPFFTSRPLNTLRERFPSSGSGLDN